jgi:hypothetical protein
MVFMSAESLSTKMPVWKKVLVIGLILMGLVFILVFARRAARSFQNARLMAGRRDGTLDVEMIRGWMPIPYIDRMFGVPQEVLYQSLGITAEEAGHDNLADLNRRLFPGQPGEALRRVKQAILDYWATHPAPSLKQMPQGSPAP